MLQEDFILREIHKIGQMLMGLIGKLMHRKEQTIEEIEEAITETLKVEATELEKLLQMNIEDIVQLKENHPKYTVENLELIANLFYELGLHAYNGDKLAKSKMYLTKCIVLNQYLDSDSTTFSFMRKTKTDGALEVLAKL